MARRHLRRWRIVAGIAILLAPLFLLSPAQAGRGAVHFAARPSFAPRGFASRNFAPRNFAGRGAGAGAAGQVRRRSAPFIPYRVRRHPILPRIVALDRTPLGRVGGNAANIAAPGSSSANIAAGTVLPPGGVLVVRGNGARVQRFQVRPGLTQDREGWRAVTPCRECLPL